MKPSYDLLFTFLAARAWFSDDPEAAEHLRVRSILMDQALSPVDPDGTKERPLFYYEYRCADYDDEKGKVLIDKALHEQDADADAALCEIIFQYVLQGRKLPKNLSVYLMLLMRRRFESPPERRREVKRASFRDRDMFIVRELARLHSMGISPTRNRESRNDTDPCGCSIVAEALTRIGRPTTERAVEEVWVDRDKDVPLD